jgi:transmembrane sensor
MEKDYLNKKWLAGEDLTIEEQEAFVNIEDNELLKKIVDTASLFSASNFYEVDTFNTLKAKIDSKRNLTKKRWLTPTLRIASVLVIAFGVYYFGFLNNNTIEFETAVAEKRMVKLPDASEVTLNAVSEITYNDKTWKEKRALFLDGEAFFKVAKGSKFDVNTSTGRVTVVGTQFNVKNRENLFEVVCFEGKVIVTYGGKTWDLLPGYAYSVTNGVVLHGISPNKVKPYWMSNSSYFKRVPFYQVIQEFERQYQVEITTDLNDENLLFTGGFTHKNLQEALQSITKPLKLTYTMVTPTKISMHQSE